MTTAANVDRVTRRTGTRDVAERLAIEPDEIAAGHCVALSCPKELTDLLVGYTAARHGT
jgi:hypothetical protein